MENLENIITKTIKTYIKEDSRSTDVRAMEKELHGSSSVTDSKDRINRPSEFKDAFDVWFKTLGFDPQENPITLSQARNDIDHVLRDLGYN